MQEELALGGMPVDLEGKVVLSTLSDKAAVLAPQLPEVVPASWHRWPVLNQEYVIAHEGRLVRGSVDGTPEWIRLGNEIIRPPHIDYFSPTPRELAGAEEREKIYRSADRSIRAWRRAERTSDGYTQLSGLYEPHGRIDGLLVRNTTSNKSVHVELSENGFSFEGHGHILPSPDEFTLMDFDGIIRIPKEYRGKGLFFALGNGILTGTIPYKALLYQGREINVGIAPAAQPLQFQEYRQHWLGFTNAAIRPPSENAASHLDSRGNVQLKFLDPHEYASM